MMKSLLADICVFILRKLNVSVIIGYEVTGKLTQLKFSGYIYDNTIDAEYVNPDGTAFDIPEGKFKHAKEAE